MHSRFIVAGSSVVVALALVAVLNPPAASATQTWRPLFNGQDLDGWTVKVTGYPAGENFGHTFRVEDGLIKVRYDAYGADF